MARKTRYAGYKAKRKARQVYRTNIKKPKRQVVKKFANFVGKTTRQVILYGKRRRRGGKRYNRRTRRRSRY